MGYTCKYCTYKNTIVMIKIKRLLIFMDSINETKYLGAYIYYI